MLRPARSPAPKLPTLIAKPVTTKGLEASAMQPP